MNAFLEACGVVLSVLLGIGAIGGTVIFFFAAAYMQSLDEGDSRP